MTALLETRAISKRFGGLEAVSGVDLRLERGEVRALIGPNGAGKTTLVSLISGRLSPTSGRVLFAGRDITSLRAWDRVGLGIVYTFQVTSIYRGISVYDNVALAAQRRHLRALSDWIALDRQAVARDVEAALVTVGLWALRDQPARALAYGHQRLLEVAMALALGPELLVLDEPTQGLAAAEGGVRDAGRVQGGHDPAELGVEIQHRGRLYHAAPARTAWSRDPSGTAPESQRPLRARETNRVVEGRHGWAGAPPGAGPGESEGGVAPFR